LLDHAQSQKAEILTVQAYGMNGSFYSQTNLWSFLGALPYKASGSAVAGYRLTDWSGRIVATGVVDRHSKFTAANKIP
jgi:hypothetical protein